MLFTVVLAYGVMAVFYYKLMGDYFPKGDVTAASFLPWFDRYPSLVFLGLAMSLGLFGHLVIMWGSPAGEHIQGLLCCTGL